MDIRERYVSRPVHWMKDRIHLSKPVPESPSEPATRRIHDNSKRGGRLTAVQRQRIFTPDQPISVNDSSIAISVSKEGELENLGFTQQEAAVYAYVLVRTIQEVYAPEDLVGEDVSAGDVGEILDEQMRVLDKNFRKVVSNGPEYYLKVRSHAVDKFDALIDGEKKQDEVVGPDFENLSLVVSSLDRSHLENIHSHILEKDPEQVVNEEFPRGVEGVDRLEISAENQDNPEKTLRHEVDDLIVLFDRFRVYDIKRGIAMYVPFTIGSFSGAFDVRNFEKAESLGVISSLGKNRLHQMDTYSRCDLVKLYWSVAHYNLRGLQKLSPDQQVELGDIERIYNELMEERKKVRNDSSGK